MKKAAKEAELKKIAAEKAAHDKAMKEEEEALMKQKKEIAAEKVALEAQHIQYVKMIEEQKKKDAAD
jgi:hypothetical protein